jgi:N6-adenosine-specific RNA methylase IME4
MKCYGLAMKLCCSLPKDITLLCAGVWIPGHSRNTKASLKRIPFIKIKKLLKSKGVSFILTEPLLPIDLSPTQAGKYRCLVIDPHWNQGKTGKRSVRPNPTSHLDYKSMSQQELEALTIGEWASDQAFLWLWATNSKDKGTKQPILRHAFDLLEIWGFTYYTTVTWNKRTGPCPFGPSQVTTEHILFGYKGKVCFPKEAMDKMQTCFTEVPTGHNVKPASFYEQVRK